ncbi:MULTISPECIES: alpha/beta fold hydrolase [unclassified Corallococcus]|uniref:alpha/beta fold hydrolase n=1 Tax=unclassified Corallococcus TaxID=2685029 RepID=UPI001A8F4A8B|nr:MULTISPECIES: alpha/beta hydrolase [unclassified Corallococcus]MBN9681685.1 alpha/beta hydrolase [Corallococcus sp. NCSPR001]WAS86744.1 alpha/beta hydrolase [Corallococcus sp. NCRR]
MLRALRPLLAVLMFAGCGPDAASESASDLVSAPASLEDASRQAREGSVRLSTGVTLRYVEQGRQDGPVVVFLHGYTDSHHTWDLDLQRFSRDFHLYALDQRGHGDSSRPACCYTQQAFAKDVVAFLDAKRVSRAVLVGHSMGSFIAQQVALDFPGRVKGLVLVGSAPTVAGNEVALGLKEVVDTLTDPVDPAFIYEFQASTFYAPVPESYLDTLVSESSKLPARVWQDALDGLIAEDHSARLGRIRVPTLIIGGDHDGFFSVDEQRALARAIRGSKYLLYPETGHAPHAERPQRFVNDVQRFLECL